jgi:hypothetical protein
MSISSPWRHLTGLLVGAALCIITTAVEAQPGSSTNQLQLPTKDYDVPLKWLGDSLGSIWEPHVALLVPVKLAGCPRQFYFQFDLGAPHSVLYQGKIKSLWEKYPEAVVSYNDTALWLNDISLKLGKQKIQATSIKLKKTGAKPIRWDDRQHIEIIGTLGMDLVKDKVLCIDYPAQQMSICNAVPASIANRATLTSITLIGNSILLPAKLKNRTIRLFFDTGSSAFELLTDKATCDTLALPGVAPRQYKANSWGSLLTVNTYHTKDSISLAGQAMPLRFVSTVEGASDSQIQRMMKLGIGGMTGNKLFLNNCLVLDTKRQQFGLLPGSRSHKQ